MRKVLKTAEFDLFLEQLAPKTIAKFDRVIEVIISIKVVPTKFLKKLKGTDFYEMRVSVGHNEYRTVLFTIDAKNIIEAKEIILISGFLKKSTKQYKKEVQKAIKILREYDY